MRCRRVYGMRTLDAADYSGYSFLVFYMLEIHAQKCTTLLENSKNGCVCARGSTDKTERSEGRRRCAYLFWHKLITRARRRRLFFLVEAADDD